MICAECRNSVDELIGGLCDDCIDTVICKPLPEVPEDGRELKHLNSAKATRRSASSTFARARTIAA